MAEPDSESIFPTPPISDGDRTTALKWRDVDAVEGFFATPGRRTLTKKMKG